MATFKEMAQQIIADCPDIFWANDYSEPGYDLEEGQKGILFANWNDESQYIDGQFVTIDDSMPRLARIAEWLGYSLEWSDEWYLCDNCLKAFRSQPNSYSWRMYGYITDDGELVCGDCVKTNPEDYLDYLADNPKRANTILDHIEFKAMGYRQLDITFEHGLYGGQDADPERILQALNGPLINVSRVVFDLSSVGQFDAHFTVWIPTDQYSEDILTLLEQVNTRCDIDPARAMEQALKDASKKMSKLPSDGIKYAKCNPDGTADVRILTPEEFVNGIE